MAAAAPQYRLYMADLLKGIGFILQDTIFPLPRAFPLLVSETLYQDYSRSM